MRPDRSPFLIPGNDGSPESWVIRCHIAYVLSREGMGEMGMVYDYPTAAAAMQRVGSERQQAGQPLAPRLV